MVELHGRPMILNVHGSGVAGHDPATGEKLWNYTWGNNFPKVAQPLTWQNDKVIITASYNQGSHMLGVLAHQDGTLSVECIWESRRMKTKFSSASIINDHLYGLDEGTLACVDLANGDRIWKDGRYGFGQHLVVGSHILLLSERGMLVLLEPSPEGHRELASLEVMQGKCWAAPTLAGTYCLLRSESEIACLRLPGRVYPP
jgi:outer membrane protein assembly factor BamB